MNLIIVVVIAIIAAAVVAGFLAASSRAEARPIVDPKEGYEMYTALRGNVLAGSREEFHLDRTSPDTEPWGVLMETGFPEGSMTLVAIRDGNASIYLSSGGGSIGGGDHESIREAAKKVVKLAVEFQHLMMLTQDFPLPQAGGRASSTCDQ